MTASFTTFIFQPSFERDSEPNFASGRITLAALEKLAGGQVDALNPGDVFERFRSQIEMIAAQKYKVAPGIVTIDAVDVQASAGA